MEHRIKQPTDGQILRDWLNSVPYGEYNAVRARMVAECMVTKQIFANWLYGLSRIPNLAKSAINSVAQSYNGTSIFNIQELAGPGVEGESNTAGIAQ